MAKRIHDGRLCQSCLIHLLSSLGSPLLYFHFKVWQLCSQSFLDLCPCSNVNHRIMSGFNLATSEGLEITKISSDSLNILLILCFVDNKLLDEHYSEII